MLKTTISFSQIVKRWDPDFFLRQFWRHPFVEVVVVVGTRYDRFIQKLNGCDRYIPHQVYKQACVHQIYLHICHFMCSNHAKTSILISENNFINARKLTINQILLINLFFYVNKLTLFVLVIWVVERYIFMQRTFAGTKLR